MKTLKQLAAEHGYFVRAEIPAFYRVNDNISQPIIPDGLQPTVEADVFYQLQHDTDWQGKKTYYVEHPIILVKHKNYDFLMSIHTDKKMWSLFPAWCETRKFNAIANNIKGEALKGLSEPNKIGIPNPKKILAWVFYCEEYLNRLTGCLEVHSRKNATQEMEIESWANSMKASGAKVSVREDGRTKKITTIQSDLFYVVITHHLEENYVRKEIKFEGNMTDVISITKKLSEKS